MPDSQARLKREQGFGSEEPPQPGPVQGHTRFVTNGPALRVLSPAPSGSDYLAPHHEPTDFDDFLE